MTLTRKGAHAVLGRLVVHWLMLAAALAVVAALLDSVTVEGGVIGLLGAALLFGLVNAILLFAAAGLSDALEVGGFLATVGAALLLSVVSTVLGWVLMRTLVEAT